MPLGACAFPGAFRLVFIEVADPDDLRPLDDPDLFAVTGAAGSNADERETHLVELWRSEVTHVARAGWARWDGRGGDRWKSGNPRAQGAQGSEESAARFAAGEFRL